jgi:hypothetical protein
MDDGLNALAEQISAKEPVRCPKCAEPISIDIVTKALDESSLSFSYKPGKGELMDVDSVMGSVSAAAKLLQSIGKQMGVATRVMLKSVSTLPEGELKFDLLITRTEKRRAK